MLKHPSNLLFTTGALAVFGTVSAALAYVLLAPSIDRSDPRQHRLTLAGKLRIKLLRALPSKALMCLWNKGRKMPLKAVQAIEERSIPTRYGGVPCRLYYPHHRAAQPLPVFISLHGGGFVIRGIDQDDALCRYLAHEAGCVVVNVDYSVAPEYPFPQAVQECFDVVNWVGSSGEPFGIDAHRIALGGYSAGGNLTAAVALMNLTENAFGLCLQILGYAPLDHVTPAEAKNWLPGKQLLTEKNTGLFTTAYLPNVAQRSDPLASPVLAHDVAGLPPALIITAEYDLLKTDSERYAQRLQEGGVAVDYHLFEGVDHGFTHVGPKRQALAAWQLIARSLKKAFD